MTLDHEIEVLEHQFARNGVKTVAGRARFVDPHTMVVTSEASEEHTFDADRIILAVGTTPHRPKDIPFNERNVFDSDNIATEPHVPRSLTVVGAGVIGIEYATIFSALDVPVTMVEPRENFLEFIDREIVDEFVHDLREARHAVPARRARSSGSSSTSTAVPSAPERRAHRCGPRRCSIAAGRTGATATLDLEALRPRGRRARAARGRPEDVPDGGAAHLRGGRRDRLSVPCVDVDGAGADRGLPRVRCADAAGAGVFSLRHLFGAGDFDGRPDRGAGAREGHSLRVRHRAVPRDLARAHHGARIPA